MYDHKSMLMEAPLEFSSARDDETKLSPRAEDEEELFLMDSISFSLNMSTT
jgi:hypothetical protein